MLDMCGFPWLETHIRLSYGLIHQCQGFLSAIIIMISAIFFFPCRCEFYVPYQYLICDQVKEQWEKEAIPPMLVVTA